MAENQAKKRRRPARPRRADFTVKQQLIGKIGHRAYGRLLDRMQREAQQ